MGKLKVTAQKSKQTLSTLDIWSIHHSISFNVPFLLQSKCNFETKKNRARKRQHDFQGRVFNLFYIVLSFFGNNNKSRAFTCDGRAIFFWQADIKTDRQEASVEEKMRQRKKKLRSMR